MENLTTRAVLKDKLSSVASDIATRVDQAVQKIGTGKASEENPISYKVTHRGGALVRAGYETTSAQVHQLPAGEVVTVVELIGRRARLVTPVEGWISIETKEGVQIMKQCTMQRKGQQNEAFETMFERKFQRAKEKQSGNASDPRATRTPSDSPERGRDRDSDRGYRDYDRDRDYDRNRDRDRGRRDPSPYSDRDDSDRDRDYDRRNDRSRKKDSYDPPRDSRSSRGDDRDREKDSGTKFVPKLSAPSGGGGGDSFVPKLSAPGAQSGPTVISDGPSKSVQSADLFDMDAPPAVASSGGALDLLDMAGPATSAPSAQPSGFDPFASAPAVAAPAPTPVMQAQPGGASNDWNAFSSAPAAPAQPANNMMAAFGGQPGMQQQQQFGGQPAMQQQQAQPPMAPGWGFNPSAPAGPQMGAAMGGMGYGGQPGMPPQGMAPQGMAPQGMAPGMAMGQGSYPQGVPGGGAWAPFGAQQAGFGAPGAPMGMPAQQRPPAPAMGAMPGQQRPPAPGAGGSVDDLLSQAMDGVSAMSFEARKGPANGTSIQSGVPMNFMMQGQPGAQWPRQ